MEHYYNFYKTRVINFKIAKAMRQIGLSQERFSFIFFDRLNPIYEKTKTERKVVIKKRKINETINKPLVPHDKLAQNPSGIKIKERITASVGDKI